MTARRLLLLIVCLLSFAGCFPRSEEVVPPLIITEAPTAVADLSSGSTQDEAPAILNFGFVDAPTKPSQAALLEWDVTGVETVKITRTGGQWGEAGEQWTVPATGSMVHTFADSLGGFELIYKLDAGDGLSAEFPVTLQCEHEWAFAHEAQVCPTAARTSNGVQQNFENGIMLSIEAQNIVLFSSWNGQTHGVYENTFDAATDLSRDERIVPPDDFYQPENALGKVWRENDDVRAALGWAIAPPVTYNVVRQGEAASRTGIIEEYIGLHDGSWIFIDQAVLVWDVTYPQPDITWSGLRPPAVYADLDSAPVTTPVSAETPSPTATSAPVVAATAIPVAIATPVPASPTSDPPTPPTDGEVVVLQFGFDREPLKPSDTVLLQWNVSGVSTIQVERRGGEWGEANASYELPAQGSLEQTFPPDVGGWPVFYMVTSPEAPSFEYAVTTEMPCEWEWQFDFPYPGNGCPERGIVSKGSMQTFQRGFMIWVESLDIILYSTWDGLANNRVTDTFVHGVDPVQDDSLGAPPGYFQPQYGFGKVWREQPGVRDMLGWGTDWSRDYTVIIQSEPFSRYGYREYVLMNGGLITINAPDPIWQVDYQR